MMFDKSRSPTWTAAGLSDFKELYYAEENPDGAVNGKIMQGGNRLSLLKVEHLRRLVWLHYRQGITLTELRTLFEKARTVPEVNAWIDDLKKTLDEQGDVPLRVLLDGLEQEKDDDKATPNVHAVRAKYPSLQQFEPERLIARLKAAENIIGDRWIGVNSNSGEVTMHQAAEQILSELERNIAGLMPEAEQIPETT